MIESIQRAKKIPKKIESVPMNTQTGHDSGASTMPRRANNAVRNMEVGMVQRIARKLYSWEYMTKRSRL
jgi:hypothetical protein